MSAEPEKVGDASDEVEDMDDDEEAGDIKSQILKRPDLVAVIQARLAAAEAKQVAYTACKHIKPGFFYWRDKILNDITKGRGNVKV